MGHNSIRGHGNVGNVVGDNNVFHVDQRRSGGGPSGSGGTDKNAGELFFGVVGVSFVLPVAAAWFFARFSQPIYLTLTLWSWFLTFAVFFLVWRGMASQLDGKEMMRRALALLLSSLLAWTIGSSANVYPEDISELGVQSESMRDFFCQLTPYGAELAIWHAAAMGFGATLTLVFLSANWTGFVAQRLSRSFSWQWARVLSGFCTWPILSISVFFCLLTAFSQTDFAWSWWTEVYVNKWQSTYEDMCGRGGKGIFSLFGFH